jgi:hypothetical protein
MTMTEQRPITLIEAGHGVGVEERTDNGRMYR